MYKIAILGCENSHADAFIGLVKAGKYPDVEVVGVYTDDESANARMRDSFGVYTAASYDEFVGKVDGIMVTARHGANHLKYARPYIESGIPMFIDKPATASVEEAVEMVRLFRKHGIRISGGSSCVHCAEVKELKAIVENKTAGEVIGGYLRAPVSLANAYGDVWFYSQHLVQIMQEIFGYYPKTVLCRQNGGQLDVVFGYEGFDVFANFVNGNYLYYASVSAEKSVEGRVVKVDESIYQPEFEAYYRVLKGGECEQSYSDFIAPVFVIDALERSRVSGKVEEVYATPTEEEL